MNRREIVRGGLALGAAAVASPSIRAQATITLQGASQFNDDHAFTKAMVKFEELVKQYYGKPVNFVLHKNSSLGLEKQYFEYMAQGRAVDYAIVSPAHMSTFSRAAPFIDAPFLFRDLSHWNKVLDQDLLKPVADEIAQKAEVMLIGYAGGGVRNIFSNKPATTLAELKGLKVRVQGAPIWSRTFQAVGMAPTVIAYNEVYNAIQNGVINAGENEAAGVEFDEVLRGRPAPPHDRARHHDPSPLLLVEDVQDVAAGTAGGGGQGRQGGGRPWPPDRILGRQCQARRPRERRQAEARPLQGPRRDEEARRSRDGRLRQGDRGRFDSREDERDRLRPAGGRAVRDGSPPETPDPLPLPLAVAGEPSRAATPLPSRPGAASGAG